MTTKLKHDNFSSNVINMGKKCSLSHSKSKANWDKKVWLVRSVKFHETATVQLFICPWREAEAVAIGATSRCLKKRFGGACSSSWKRWHQFARVSSTIAFPIIEIRSDFNVHLKVSPVLRLISTFQWILERKLRVLKFYARRAEKRRLSTSSAFSECSSHDRLEI